MQARLRCASFPTFLHVLAHYEENNYFLLLYWLYIRHSFFKHMFCYFFFYFQMPYQNNLVIQRYIAELIDYLNASFIIIYCRVFNH